jgi:hypothetical protein
VGQSGEPSFQIQKDDFGDLEAMAVEGHRGKYGKTQDAVVMTRM